MTLKRKLKLLLSAFLFIVTIIACMEVFSFVHKQSAVGNVISPRDTSRRVKERPRSYRIRGMVQKLEERRYPNFAWDPHLWRIVTRFQSSHGASLPKGVPSLVILIASAPENIRQRNAIRTAWSRGLNGSPPAALTVFLVGRTENPEQDKVIANEVKDEGDVLLGNYKDSYRNLTLKTVHGLIWAGMHLKPLYVLKTDDDCFVNTKVLNDVLTGDIAFRLNRLGSSARRVAFTMLQNVTPEKKVEDAKTLTVETPLSMFSGFQEYSSALYVGSIRWENEVVRDAKNRWYVSEQDFSASQYPPYPSGAGYVLDAAALSLFIRTVRYVRPFANEDAYVGSVLNEAGVEPQHSSRFSARTSSFWTCNLLYLVVIHGVQPAEQAGLVKRVQEAKQECRGLEVELGWN